MARKLIFFSIFYIYSRVFGIIYLKMISQLMDPYFLGPIKSDCGI